jgi:hypothetical protein
MLSIFIVRLLLNALILRKMCNYVAFRVGINCVTKHLPELNSGLCSPSWPHCDTYRTAVIAIACTKFRWSMTMYIRKHTWVLFYSLCFLKFVSQNSQIPRRQPLSFLVFPVGTADHLRTKLFCERISAISEHFLLPWISSDCISDTSRMA